MDLRPGLVEKWNWGPKRSECNCGRGYAVLWHFIKDIFKHCCLCFVTNDSTRRVTRPPEPWSAPTVSPQQENWRGFCFWNWRMPEITPPSSHLCSDGLLMTVSAVYMKAVSGDADVCVTWFLHLNLSGNASSENNSLSAQFELYINTWRKQFLRKTVDYWVLFPRSWTLMLRVGKAQHRRSARVVFKANKHILWKTLNSYESPARFHHWEEDSVQCQPYYIVLAINVT